MNASDIILDDMDGLYNQIAEKLNELMNKAVVRSIDDQMDMLDTELEYLRKVME